MTTSRFTSSIGGGFIEGAAEPCKIIYTASSKLDNSKYNVGATFCGATITKHDFSNGNGVIEFDDDITQIENSGCFGLSSVTSFVLPDSITSIGECVFKYCSGLVSINIPDSVTSIGSQAFSNCYSLTSINIPDSVTSIGSIAFNDCESLTTVTVGENNTVYNSHNNCNAIIETASNTLIRGCIYTVIPDSVTSIGESAFSKCSNLVSINIPDSVTSIGESAFSECSNLVSINIPDSVISIGSSAFSSCTSLTELTLPESIESIGGQMCYNDTNLVVICLMTSVPTITDSYYGHPFADVRKILVTSANVELYKTTWPEVADKIEAIA